MRERLRGIKPVAQHAVLVAESAKDGVIGWLHVSREPLLEVEIRAEVNGLVVAEGQRSAGAGARSLRRRILIGSKRGPSSRCSSGHASSSDAKRGPSLPMVARDRHTSSHVWLTITPPPPMFFVSVDSRGFRFVVSCLESTLVGWLVSVAFKLVRAGTIWRGSRRKRDAEASLPAPSDPGYC